VKRSRSSSVPAGRIAASLALAASLAFAGCDDHGASAPPPGPAPAPQQPSAEGPDTSPQSPEPEPEPEVEPEPPPTVPTAEDGELWRTLGLSDIGPAGPASAFAGGVVMVTKDNRLLVSRLSSRQNVDFSQIEEPSGSFARYGRGPAVLGKRAYWVNGSHLLRGALSGKQAEVLTTDARHSTRVSAETLGKGARRRDAVIYVARTKLRADLEAKLWMDGFETARLTPEGSAASSVALIEDRGALLAVSLEGRTSMSPVHVRRVELKGEERVIGPDVVAWVGPPSQPLTEVMTLPAAGGGALAFLTLERDVTHFGLALVHLEERAATVPEALWRAYPNGIDPAPVATSNVCSRPAVLFAVPSTARPRAPQELHLAYLAGRTLGSSQVIARSRAFSDVSIAAGSGRTAVVAWVADHRTWALYLECRG
jgi:hypothetical protein